ncbi:MAG TPA: hypothetical protein VFZ69_15000 [Longimicrobiales bacterium]
MSGTFLRELKRRKVVRVAAVYGATAFVVLQAADLLVSGLALPGWVFSAITVLTIVGFPIALVLAWAFELTPQGLDRDGAAPAARTPQRWLPARTLAVVVLLLLIGGTIGWLLNANDSSPAEPERSTSLVVLPFTNLGDPGDEYFADGISDALRGKLAGIEGLVVIASSSSRPYKGTEKAPHEIGRELGVRYLLTGTVRWARSSDGTSRVQVSPELIAAETGTTRWQQPFDAVLSDVFAVQGDIAGRVADALSVTLLEPQRRDLAAPPTGNLDAYDEYLRASALLGQAELGAPLRRLAADGFRRAVELDPDFALAWARLAYAHMGAYWFGEDHADARARLVRARAAADTALLLAPDLVDAHLADGYYWYWGWRAYDRALASFERARALAPRNSAVEGALAVVLRRQGRFAESAEYLRGALALDRLNATGWRELALTLVATGALEEAEQASVRAITLAPEAIGGYMFRAQVLYALEDGSRAAATLRDAMRVLGAERLAVEMANRQWTRWLAFTDTTSWRVLENLPLTALVVDTGSLQLFRAEWLHLIGRHPAAAALADSALPFLERSARQAGADWWFPGQLALAHALAGREEPARRELRRAAAALASAPDAWDRPYLAHHSARVATLIGDTVEALSQLAEALRRPSPIPPAFVRADIRFAPLRDAAGFSEAIRPR